MAKKKKKIIPIDCIPKYSQKPRSSPPKRRTDFSVFTCTPSSIFLSPDSSSDSYSRAIRLSNFTASNLQKSKMKIKQYPDDTLVRCSRSKQHRSVCSSEFSDVPVKGVDSAVQDEGLNPDSYSNSLVTPGSVVWARTASHMWWPAEIMEERSTLSDPASDGHVLVQFYGNPSSLLMKGETTLPKILIRL